jgi:predicted metalloprotease with PDZ domain
VGGIERGGYRLVFRDTPNPYDRTGMGMRRTLDLTHSLGARLSSAGVVTDVRWGGPLFEAGLAGGATIAAIDGEAYSDEALKAAITRAKTAKAPIRLLVREGKRVREVAIDYHDGLRWPWLEKTATGEALLDRALSPL